MKITHIRPKQEIPKLLAGMRPFRSEGARIAGHQHITRNGKLIDVEITASQFHYRGRPAVLVEVEDITERKRTEDTLRNLAVLEERNRIAREMHDTLAQGFTGIILQLEAALDVLNKSPKKSKDHITHARNLARKSLAEARQSVWQIRPHKTHEKGIASAIRHMARQAKEVGVPIHFRIEGTPHNFSAEMENNVFRITQEALTNSIRHAGATSVELSLCFNRSNVEIVIEDNGKGFFPECYNDGFGLISIQERANQIGAKVSWKSAPGKGCKVTLTVPV